MLRFALVLPALLGAGLAHAGEVSFIDCGSCAEWNQPQKPFKVAGNTWYVGTKELSALLVTSPQGHILLDGDLPQSAPLIRANIEALGFKVGDIKYILNSHAHWDHAGGIAALQTMSGATVVASAWGLKVLQAGEVSADDPQYDAGHNTRFTPVTGATKVVADGDVIKVGPLAVTAHLTPGHTPGGTTWSWQSCEQGKCYNVVYADSLNPVSNDTFRFSGDATHHGIADSFRASIATVGALPCDIAISVHPGFTETLERAAKSTPAHNALVDPAACQAYASDANHRLTLRLAKEAEALIKAAAH
ncbi:MAG: subclass B3 metallo-beta-lactamase [Telluria sp.]